MTHLRQIWTRSKVYRVVLTVTVIYAFVRLAVHFLYLAVLAMPALSGLEEPAIPIDLQLYVDAANKLWAQQDLYPVWDRIEVYQYSPTFALLFTPFAGLSPIVLVISQTLLHIVAYILLYARWSRIFRRSGLERAREMLAWTLPIWLVFSAFWSDLGYLNIYIIVAFLATMLIEAVLDEHLGWSLLWLTLILQIKPHWAFVVVVPLFLGRWRFFVKLVLLVGVVYVAVTGLTALLVGLEYGWRQHYEYLRLLWNMRQYFPWRGPDAGFLGYNHSITQVTTYLLGVTPGALRLATGIKILLLTPLGIVGLRHLFRPIGQPGHRVPIRGLSWTFAAYMGIFIWLDMVWELSLGIAVFVYLLAILEHHRSRIWIWIVFLPYALVDLWQLLSVVVFGPDVVLPGMYILTDPTIYVPLIMIVILTFYVLLLKRLWSPSANRVRRTEMMGARV